MDIGILLGALIMTMAYWYWRVQQVRDPKAFIKDRLLSPFITILFMFFVSYLTINIAFPNGPSNPETDKQPTKNNNPSAFKKQLNKDFKNLSLHREFINNYFQNLGEDNLISGEVIPYYKKKISNEGPKNQDIGNYCLGLCYLKLEEYNKAIKRFGKIKGQDFKYLSYYYGKAHYNQNNLEEAIQSLTQVTKNGNKYSAEAAELLYIAYTNSGKDKALADFVTTTKYLENLPIRNAQYETFKSGSYGAYTYLLGMMFWHAFTVKGLIAAVLITLAWGVFVWKMNLNKQQKLSFVIGTLFLGGLFSFGTFYLTDFLELFTGFHLNGKVLNDLLYSIVGIGLIEEVIKIIPLLLVLKFTKGIKEPYDFLLFASFSALGFAFVENLQYLRNGFQGVVIGRTLTATIFHMVLSSMVAYSLAKAYFKQINKPAWVYFLIYLIIASIIHGIYDFFLFQQNFFFFLFAIIVFLYVVRIWSVMINNTLNNATSFDYKQNAYFDNLRFYIVTALGAILFLDYILTGWIHGASEANQHFWGIISSGGIMILVIATNLSRFDLIPGYWRNVELLPEGQSAGAGKSQEHGEVGGHLNQVAPKGGVATALAGIFSANSVYPKNFVGQRVEIDNYVHNEELEDALTETVYGTLMDRKIIKEDEDDDLSLGDPDWFLLQLDEPLKLDNQEHQLFLMQFKSKNPELDYDEDLMALLTVAKVEKDLFREPVCSRDLENLGWIIVNKA